MTEPDTTYIDRSKPGLGGPDFARLKAEGLEYLQDLCGRVWTDYNLHDPGVTILEQLCYALTDLMYRTGFETADYLTAPDGRLDFDRQALYRPWDILPSQPITPTDYRKILADAIPELGNVWIRPDAAVPGLYHVDVKPTETDAALAAPGDLDALRRRIADLYMANRNLGEDLEAVHVVGSSYYTLHGTVEIDSERDAAELLAELYFACARFIAPEIQFYAFDALRARGKSLEDLLTGPLTRHGYVDAAELEDRHETVTLSEVIGIVGNIPGVRYVADLRFEDENDRSRRVESISREPQAGPNGERTVPCLRIPATDAQIGVQLLKDGRVYRAALRDLRTALERLEAEARALRHLGQEVAAVEPLPQGEFRPLRAYASVQDQFPNLYGINRYGVPDDALEPERLGLTTRPQVDAARTKRQAQARQLKAYLLFFEQLMANFLANLQEIPRLFSRDRDLQRSYFHQVLRHPTVPHVEELYQDDPAQFEARLIRLLRQYDPFTDRRHRVLNYLLAIYGERFTQNSLRHFNYYSADELELKLIQNKLTFLEHLVELSQNRARAFNYRLPSWNTDNVSCLKKKLGILLDFKYAQNRSLTDVLLENGLELISDEQLARLQEGTLELEFVDLGDIEDRIHQRYQDVPLEPSEGDRLGLFNDIVFLKHNVVSESILRNGIELDRYRVGSAGANGLFQVLFRPDAGSRWCYLAAYPTEAEAIRAANGLRDLLLDLNVDSEGLHLVEHLLLRPLGRAAHTLDVPGDFYPFQISAVFPSWTARFHDEEFRKLVVETVHLNCPAHLDPVFYWLDFGTMRDFEDRYRRWLELKRDPGASADALDAAAEHLLAFLLEHRPDT